jgi:hypothetical protein
MTEIVTLPVRAFVSGKQTLLVSDPCPLCGERHVHGLGGPIDEDLGTRVPHCASPENWRRFRRLKDDDPEVVEAQRRLDRAMFHLELVR